ncbi:hypothetical protein C4K22_6309 [Pseudomonas chlororaphis subsp. aurantiaca]|nr:hypothetical protein C4K22_6309 [Pseudomonas chlororaphis subsp. aurantiaca]AZD45348.1 hypothetical protein C4K21_6319 [Pseudomonas chlororaphis subsp. aurantiaca]
MPPKPIAACGSGYTIGPDRTLARSRCRAREAAIALGGTPS